MFASARVAASNGAVWLFSSSQGIDHLIDTHLRALTPPVAANWSHARALSTHPRITERARRLGFTHILETRPTLQAVVEALRPVSAFQAGVDTIKSP